MKTYELKAVYNLKEHTIRVKAKTKKDSVDLFIKALYNVYSYLDKLQIDCVFSRNKIYTKAYRVD